MGGGISWTRKRSITIDNTGNSSALSDYQIKVAFTSSNYDFNLGLPNGADLRFTDSDDATVLSYWVEAFDAVGQTATIWVNVPSIAPSASKTIYLYYGNRRASVGSNGDATFPIFDDFDQFNSSGWQSYGGNPIITPALSWENTFTRDPFVMPPQSQGDTWKMWYWGDNANLGYATSTDGLAWTKVQQLNVSGARPSVVLQGGTYYLFINDATFTKIQVCTASNPQGPFSAPADVLTANVSWEASTLNVPSVIYDTDDSTWKMWYSGGVYTPPGAGYTEPLKIGYATSSSPTSGWAKSSLNPIMVPAADTSWFASAMQSFRVTKVSGVYYACYISADIWGVSRFGFVSSKNPIDWALYEKQLVQDVGAKGQYNQDFVYGGNPVYYNSQWSIYFNARTNATNTEKIGVVQQLGSIANQLNPAKWKRSRQGAITVNNAQSLANIDASVTGVLDAMIFSHRKMADVISEAKVRIKSGYTNNFTLAQVAARFNGSNYDALNSSFGADTAYENSILSGSSTNNKNNSDKIVSGTETSLNSATRTINRDQWYVMGLSALGTAIKTFQDGTQIFSGTDSGVTAEGYEYARAFQSVIDIDWVRARKATSPEPSTSVGASSPVQKKIAPVISTITVPEGLIGYWPLDGGVALDKSGNGLTGALSGATPPSSVAGQIATALTFNGSTGYVDIAAPAILNRTGSLSLMAWIWLNSTFGSGYQAIIGRWNDSAPRSYLLCLGSSGSGHNNAVFFLNSTIGTTALDSGSAQSFYQGKWSHVAGVYDRSAGAMKFYTNAVLDGSGAFTDGALQGNTRNNQIGNHTSNTAFFNGKIDDVRMYDRALTAAEVLAIYTAGLAGNP